MADTKITNYTALTSPADTDILPIVDMSGTPTTKKVTRGNLMGSVVTLTGTQTLTNKTLTSPIISTISNTGTLTLPTSTDTLVGRATTDTLTNKTLTSPTLNTPTIATPTITNPVITVGSDARGDIYFRGASGFTRLGTSTSGFFLKTQGAGADPIWASAVPVLATCGASTNGAQATANNTWFPVPLGTENWDSGTMHDTVTNNTRITVPTTGYYIFVATIEFGANASGFRVIAIAKNGTREPYNRQQISASSGSDSYRLTTSEIMSLTAADYVEMHVIQDSGGALNVIGALTVHQLS